MARSFVRWTVAACCVCAARPPLVAIAQSAIPPLKVIDTRFINKSVSACTDFFEFANGAWFDHDTIPAAYSNSGVGREMRDRNELVVRSVLDDAMAHRNAQPAGSTQHKLGVFYATCMDSSAAEQAGFDPIRPRLAAIAAVTARPALVQAIADLQMDGGNVAFSTYSLPDAHDAAHYMDQFGSGGLGLPDRDYYTLTDSASVALRNAYVEHVAKYFVLTGEPAATAHADARAVLALETELAKATLTRVQQRDPAATDHPMTLVAFRAMTPNVDWTTYFHDIGLNAPMQKVNVQEPVFYKRLNALIATTPMDAWRAYLRYHAIDNAARWLSSPFAQEQFQFSARFSGAKTMLPRWKRCLQETDSDIGEALGQAYVAKTFSPAARARAKSVIDDIRAAFGARIEKLTWMSDSTKKAALVKLAAVREKVGYPDRWRDYTRLETAEGPFTLNVDRAARFEWQRTINRPGQPVDTTEWGITVPTVDAYNDPTKNEMVFPAGALSPQTFDPNADDAANYGALGGSWAGHELTHGFDDEGRHYDAHGNLRDWWTASDSVHFTREAQKVVDQFNGYIQVDTFHVNGKLTLGENIADFGGLLTGYDALQAVLARKGRPGSIEGYTPEQRFFIAYAQGWRVHTRPEALRSRVTVDPHAPERWRVNGPLSNMPSFAAAFHCKAGDPMVRPPAVAPHIW